MAVPALVKGVWFVTARRHLLDVHGDTALQAVARAMNPDHGRVLLEPLPSQWYAEGVFQDALRAVMEAHARHDADVFSQFIEACTVLGVNTFFRVLLRITSPAFLMRKMPGLSRQYRRNDWVCDVEADDHRALISWRRVPYLSDRNYRLYLVAMMAKCSELCTGKRPTITVGGHGDDWIKLQVVY
ncbi:MAG TPA: hypothetical protein VMI75_29665 [Polyangiaceae bacterium]|nr:hypothetical protein [Polyangiaceae bacterium]